jgi:glyceraldehyde-3-phosphate dehydrogenase type I
MSETRVGIKGFGRIGRAVFRQALDRDDVTVVAINDLVGADDLAYLLRYDSVYGRLGSDVALEDGQLRVGDLRVAVSSEKDPSSIRWSDHDVDVVVEATGAFRAREKAAAHLQHAPRVLISAPSDDADAHIVHGVNHDVFDPDAHQVVSATSCTTNCLVPMLHVLDEAFGLELATFTTVHAYTASQTLVDTAARKRRRGRAAGVNLIPTSTGAAKASERALPHLAGRIEGMAMRAPVPVGSVTDLVAQLRDPVDTKKLVSAFRTVAHGALEGVLRLEEEEIVSCDIVGDPHSCVIDQASLSVQGDHTAKILGWYDNEWGYSARLLDLSAHMAGVVGTRS